MNIELRADNNLLSIYSPASIIGGSKNYYSLKAIFTNDWDNLTRYVVFPNEACSIVMDVDGGAVLPETLTAEGGILKFGIIGVDSEENLRIATNYVRLRVIEGAKKADAPPPPPPVSDAWEEYVRDVIDQVQSQQLAPLKTQIEQVKTQIAQAEEEIMSLKYDNAAINNVLEALANYVIGINARLGGLTFAVDENGILTIETED